MGNMSEISEAVKDYINAQTYSETFTAVRRYAPQYDLDDLTELIVTVVPATATAQTISRSAATYEIGIDIGVQKALTGAEDCDLPASVDGLMDLVEEIEESIRFQSYALDSGANAFWVRSERTAAFEQEHMMGKTQTFTGVFRVFYKVTK